MHAQSGKPLHPIGIGTWTLGGFPVFSPGQKQEVAALQHAVSLGQNHIDTAEMYANGRAEKVVGRAVQSLKRRDIFIASKLWKHSVAKGAVRPAIEAIRKRLDTDYLDMLYIHAPWFDAPWREAIPQINQLIDDGTVRYFGVSNFPLPRLQEALALSRHPIAANQMHYSCLHQQEVPAELRDFCADNDITIVAYMPIERNDVANYAAVQQIADAHNATPAQIALAWTLAKNALPIPKATNIHHIDQNATAADTRLSTGEIATLDRLSF